jgi:hypothetical protein
MSRVSGSRFQDLNDLGSQTAIRRLKNKKSTSTIMALSDALSPVFSGLYQEIDEKVARGILHNFCRLICAAWDWVKTTEDAKGEQKVHIAISQCIHPDQVGYPDESPLVGRNVVWTKSWSSTVEDLVLGDIPSIR